MTTPSPERPEPSGSLPTPREPLSRRALSLRLLPGTRVAGYLVGAPLGEGGMGQVYAAVDERLGRNVALKVLADDDAEGRARFLREARALARIEHHNVVRVYASGENDGLAWMALEVIAGDALSSLADNQPLDEETAVALCAQLARGLAAVHAVGVVHRDVKPSNVLVDDEATVKLIDFGVAHFEELHTGGFRTRAGVVVGTPHFMSPEQARGAVVDARSDAWGLGATLYSLLAGVPPFFNRDGGGSDEADLDILARVVRDDVADIRTLAPSTSSATAQLVSSLLQRDANARPVDLGAVAHTLEEIGAALAAGTMPVAPAAVASSSSPSMPSSSSSSSLPVVPAPIPAPATPAAREGVSAGVVVVGMVVVAAAVVGGIVGGRYLFQPAPTVVERVVERPVEVLPPPPAIVTPPPIVVAPPVVETPPPAPTADSIAADVAATQGEARAKAIDGLLRRDDALGVAALGLVIVGPDAVGDDVVAALRSSVREDTEALLETVLTTPTAPRRRQLRAIELLLERRNDRALSLLMRIASGHKDPVVRAKAADARDMIFKVE